MKIPFTQSATTTAERLERHAEIEDLELSPFTYDLRRRLGEEMAPEERATTERQLRRTLLEEILPHTIKPIRARRLGDIYTMIHGVGARQPVAALCLSGGGIRSAAFSLGVLQSLARTGWLQRFHYLSTVSGGGYIGGWLSAWMHHSNAQTATRGLVERSNAHALEAEAAPIRHLRTYANYLSPKLGLLSADTWTLAATYLRNLLLTWLVLVPLLTSVLLVPWIAVSVLGSHIHPSLLSPRAATYLLMVLGILTGAVAIAITERNRPDASGRRDLSRIPERDRTQAAFLKWCLLPLVTSVLFLATSLTWAHGSTVATSEAQRVAFFVGIGVAIHLIGYVFGALISHWTWRPNRRRKIWITVGEVALMIVAGASAGLLAYVLVRSFSFGDALRTLKVYAWLAAPVFMLLLMAGSFIVTGFGSRVADDSEREWSARYAAWILIPAAVWVAVAGLVLFGPDLLARVKFGNIGATLLAVVSGTAVAKFGNSPRTSAEKAQANASKLVKSLPTEALLNLGAVIFVALLIVGLSVLGTNLVRGFVCGYRGACDVLWPGDVLDPVFVSVALLGVGLLMARLIDTNRFSLHAMYRARLIRTFLGASRRGSERHPDPFTGFDEQDDLPMNALGSRAQTQRPMHVVNMALNLVAGANLAWQDRKARSFTVSPLHAGSIGLGYRRVKPAAGVSQRVYGDDGAGIKLGTAMTISGAAASPNMGYHSSPLVTFLMTFFNLRLGWWLGNPGPAGNDTFHRAQPTLAVRPIIDELFGRTDDRNAYVYLSDGGHFENLGLYEMVMRRCHRIVVVDASCDHQATFEDLGNAIRKVGIDLGVPIEFEAPFSIHGRRRSRNGDPVAYWALAAVRYDVVDGSGAVPGQLYYLKPAVYGTEPRDVHSYARSSRRFPHESTADQFFSESQLESYRSLGRFIGDEFFRGLQARQPNYDPASGFPQ